MEKETQAINAFIVPFFFVVTGMQVDVGALATPSMVGAVLLVSILAAASKYVGGVLGAWSLRPWSRRLVGIGMVPRGEVGIIVAAIGQRAGVFDARTYALIVAMSLITAMVAPPLLKRHLAGEPDDIREDRERERDEALARRQSEPESEPILPISV